MTAAQTDTVRPSRSRSRLAVVAFAAGLLAALLTTVLSFISLVAGVLAVVTGIVAFRRDRSAVLGAVGAAMASVSVYVVLLEVLVTGG